jgi:hypothetical protein
MSVIESGGAYVVYIKGNIAEGVDRKQLLSHYEFCKEIALNSFHVMAVNKRPTLWSFFWGSISPSKMGRIAPFLATIQPFSC